MLKIIACSNNDCKIKIILKKLGYFVKKKSLKWERHTQNFHIAAYLGITQQSLSRNRVEKVKKWLSYHRVNFSRIAQSTFVQDYC